MEQRGKRGCRCQQENCHENPHDRKNPDAGTDEIGTFMIILLTDRAAEQNGDAHGQSGDKAS